MARGAGSGLSGGALPVKDGVLIVLSRMKRILEIDLDNGRVCVEPGVTNANVSRRGRPGVLLSARPVVADRLLDRRQRGRELRRRALLQVRLHDQLRHRAGARARRRRAGARSAATSSTRPATTCSARSSAPRARWAWRPRSGCGSCPSPETVKTLVAFFDSTHAAGEAVSRDRPGRRRAGRDRDDGRARDRGVRADGARRLPGRPRRRAAGGARRLPARVRGALRRGRRRSASAAAPTTCASPATRPSAQLFWKTRKAAFPAMGRISPNYFVQDGVIPRTKLPEVLERIDAARRRSTD